MIAQLCENMKTHGVVWYVNYLSIKLFKKICHWTDEIFLDLDLIRSSFNFVQSSKLETTQLAKKILT